MASPNEPPPLSGHFANPYLEVAAHHTILEKLFHEPPNHGQMDEVSLWDLWRWRASTLALLASIRVPTSIDGRFENEVTLGETRNRILGVMRGD